MKNRLFIKALIVLTLVFNLLFLTQCDLIIGSGDRANVLIDLSDLVGDGGRKVVGLPVGITITGFRISVFGPGMRRMEQTISPTMRAINLQVPPGEDRYFTLEMFFTIIPSSQYSYPHVRSYKGRLNADLRPGRTVNLRFRMAAAATTLLVPDCNRFDTGVDGRIYEAENINFTPYNSGTLGIGRGFYPTDLDISTDGMIFVTNAGGVNQIAFADYITGPYNAPITVTTPTALAMDRDLNFDIDGNNSLDFNVLYYATDSALYFRILDSGTPGNPITLDTSTLGINTINGLAVDPWTHNLYIAGLDAARNQALFVYNPLYSTRPQRGQILIGPILNSQFAGLQDIIVKDDSVFVLNQVPLNQTQTPILLRFSKNLAFLGGFGTISSNNDLGQWQFEQSFASGKFYHPKRFIAQENSGLFIIDDSPGFDKLIYINEELDPASWRTFPTNATQLEPFAFFE